VIVSDDGRGIPIGMNKTTKLSSVDTVFTVLNAGGKFDDSAYKSSGGLHGVGASVVNALSSWMVVEVSRDGLLSQSKYEDGGKIVQPLQTIGKSFKTGTTVHFMPDTKIFKELRFNPSIVEERIRESSYLYKNLKIVFNDENTDTHKTFESKTGIGEYVEFINDGKSAINNVAYFEGKSHQIEVEVALQYTTSNSEIIISFANSVKTREGGSHETSFKTALTEVINYCARK
jgi:topoisomerase-4 subunit B